MTKHQEMQRIIRYYKETTGRTDVNMKEVARFAAQRGWPIPAPVDPLDRLAKEFSLAAREEIRRDERTGQPYRANHAMTIKQGDQQMTFWIDIDEAPRYKMVKCAFQRREQMVGDGLQLTLDLDHWNSVNQNEEPILVPMDLTDDIEWRKNAPDVDEQAI